MIAQAPNFYERLEHKVVMKNVQSNEILLKPPFQLHFQCINQ